MPRKTAEEIAQDRIQEAQAEGDIFLDLSGLGLSSVPESLGQLAKLQKLYLYNNQLTNLPECVGQLAQLQELYLFQNQLTSLPECLGQLAQLKVLSLFDNQLTCLPECLGQLTQVNELNLYKNQLTCLPECLGQLAQLHELKLSENQLTSLPKCLGQLAQLHELNLYNNQLTSLPECLGQLAQLRELNLSENKLTSLPECIRSLKHLRIIYLHGNPALNFPPEILGATWWEVFNSSGELAPASPTAILDYYFRTRGGSRPLNEIKLILVGRGEVGKTSLVNRLVHDSFTCQDKTEGIQISHLPLTCGSDKIRTNVWDFGGQEIMHGTHQFFLTERSLYLLVLNGRGGGEDADVEYWLKLIGSFGGDSPVIVALNKIDEHRFDLNRPALSSKYPSIRDFVETDCKSGKGLDMLRQTITRETDRLEHVRTLFPATWFTIKERLSTTTEDFISFDSFREICRDLGETDEEAQEFLAGHLHNLGVALNYKDDSRLRDTSVLNPHWVTTGIYKLLNAQALSDQRGELCLSQLGDLLPQKHYPKSKHLFLIELMRKFELCFPLDNGGGGERYLVPELLGKQEPETLDADFPPEACLNFEYHYNPILPEGLLPRFIVRTYALGDPARRWRTGAVLSFDDCSAVVKADIQDRRVIIRVTGPVQKRRALLAVIRQNFESIHRDFKKLDPVAKVPIPGHPKHSIAYKDLLLYEKKGRKDISLTTGEDILDFEVSKLLEGIDIPTASSRSVNRHTMETRPLRLFYSYSHKDERLRDELQTHLTLLQIEGLIEPWHDRKILAGEEWDQQISHHLEQADIILLLFSADFNASKYCRDIEVKRAMERHEEQGARVIPVALRSCDWKTTPFAKLQGLPRDMRIIDGPRPRRDKLWTEVAGGLRAVIKEMQAK